MESLYDAFNVVNDPDIKKRADLFVEVLTDNFLDLEGYSEKVNQIVTPKEYQTTNNSKFKARALHYGSEHSQFIPNSWILHMDEET